MCSVKENLFKEKDEKSFGGFESLGEEDSSEDELENVPEEMKTKDGYLKDGFVVDTPPPVENS